MQKTHWVAFYFVVNNRLQILFGWWAEDAKDVAELVQVVLSRENRSVAEHLSEDTADRPDINWFGVTLEIKCFKWLTLEITCFNWETYNNILQPTHHLKETLFCSYSALTLEFSMISGARYHRVATYSVKNPVWSCSGSATRAKPKSQI